MTRKEIFRRDVTEFVNKNFDDYAIMVKQTIIEDMVEVYERYVPDNEKLVKKTLDFIGSNGPA